MAPSNGILGPFRKIKKKTPAATKRLFKFCFWCKQTEIGDDGRMQRFVPVEALFKERHFDGQIIIPCASRQHAQTSCIRRHARGLGSLGGCPALPPGSAESDWLLLLSRSGLSCADCRQPMEWAVTHSDRRQAHASRGVSPSLSSGLAKQRQKERRAFYDQAPAC